MIVPLHVYSVSCEVLRGLKVNMELATRSLGGGVAMMMSFPDITGPLPSAFIHIAVGMATRPEISSDTVQVKVYSDPATLLPELLTVAEMGSEGTAQTWYRASHYMHASYWTHPPLTEMLKVWLDTVWLALPSSLVTRQVMFESWRLSLTGLKTRSICCTETPLSST